VRELDPGFARSNLIVAAYEQKQMFNDALADISKMRPSPTDDPWTLSELAEIYGRMGQRDQAQLWLTKLEALNRRRRLDPAAFFRPSIAMGDKEQAFAWLEKAYSQHANAMVTIKVDPLYDPLRGDPRFDDLLRRVGLAE
jgi:tetratricopeptide (TPR) repeat protein